jgi:hypothetical protein
MNMPNQPPPIPPVIPPAGTKPNQLGDDPAEHVPIPSIIAAVECVLRHPRRVMFQLRQPGGGKLIGALLFISIVCSLIYGAVVGSFSGGMQWWAAPVKISGGLLVSALICLPSLYIFACLGGAQVRLAELFGLVAGLLALMTVLLIGFAPVAWIFSQSTDSVAWMGFLHLMFWFISTAFGLRFLQVGFSHAQAKSNAGFNVWVIIFMLVMVQMTTALRPLIGTSDTFLPTTKQFFLAHWGECMGAQGGESRSTSRD